MIEFVWQILFYLVFFYHELWLWCNVIFAAGKYNFTTVVGFVILFWKIKWMLVINYNDFIVLLWIFTRTYFDVLFWLKRRTHWTGLINISYLIFTHSEFTLMLILKYINGHIVCGFVKIDRFKVYSISSKYSMIFYIISFVRLS